MKDIYLDGAWVPALSDSVIEVENPATQETIGEIPACTGRYGLQEFLDPKAPRL